MIMLYFRSAHDDKCQKLTDISTTACILNYNILTSVTLMWDLYGINTSVGKTSFSLNDDTVATLINNM